MLVLVGGVGGVWGFVLWWWWGVGCGGLVVVGGRWGCCGGELGGCGGVGVWGVVVVGVCLGVRGVLVAVVVFLVGGLWVVGGGGVVVGVVVVYFLLFVFDFVLVTRLGVFRVLMLDARDSRLLLDEYDFCCSCFWLKSLCHWDMS
ncbi:hypothetical protein RA279_27660, partial [Pseudomonas syringae pv. tagetis]